MFVCLSICPLAYLKNDMSNVAVARSFVDDSTSHFVDDVMFSRNGTITDTVSHQVAPGVKSAVAS